jgi:hypothetical protein
MAIWKSRFSRFGGIGPRTIAISSQA